MAKKRKNKKRKADNSILEINSNKGLVVLKKDELDKKDISENIPSKDAEQDISRSYNIKVEDNSENKKVRKNWFWTILDYIVEKQFASKFFIICFSAFLFGYIYLNHEGMKREVLSYVGLILTMVICYIELVNIRDHLWILEGSMPYSKKWREAFFSPKTLRNNKIKKIIILLFAFIVFIFAYVYKFRSLEPYKGALSFIGTILMVIAVYFESLAIRDEVAIMNNCLKQLLREKSENNPNQDQAEEKKHQDESQ